MISPQLEVDGGTTTRKLDNLISQTEYALAVTPVYDEGSALPMLAEGITGKNVKFSTSQRSCTYEHQSDPSSPAKSADVVPAPKNLQFSDITQTSFVATWEHGAPDVALYRIGWTKRGEGNFQYVSSNLRISCTFTVIC